MLKLVVLYHILWPFVFPLVPKRCQLYGGDVIQRGGGGGRGALRLQPRSGSCGALELSLVNIIYFLHLQFR